MYFLFFISKTVFSQLMINVSCTLFSVKHSVSANKGAIACLIKQSTFWPCLSSCFFFFSLRSTHCLPPNLSLSVYNSSMAVSKLEPELRDSIVSQYGDAVQHVYFNKGLWGWQGWLALPIWHTRPDTYSICGMWDIWLIMAQFFFFFSFYLILFLWFKLFLFSYITHKQGALCTPVEKPNDLISGTAHYCARLKLR